MQNHHFFGPFRYDEETHKPRLCMRELANKARFSGTAHFTAQIRYLLDKERVLIIEDHTSAPPFPDFLAGIDPNQVGMVRIHRRKDLSEGYNLGCTLVMVEGVLEIRAHWTPYKELRAHELIDTLLRPLNQSGLHARTVLLNKEQEVVLPADAEQQIREVFSFTDDAYAVEVHGEMSFLRGYLEDKDYPWRRNGLEP